VNCYFMTFQLSTFENLNKKIEVTRKEQLNFFSLILQAIINAMFIATNIVSTNPYQDRVYYYLFYVISGAEGILWFMYFSRFLYNVYSLTKRICEDDDTHFQTKNLAMHLNSIASISILKYVPSSELISLFATRFKQTFDQKIAYYKYQIGIAEKFVFLAKIRICYEAMLEFFGPILGILSLSLKLYLLTFTTSKVIYKWSLLDFIKFIGFINQVTGMREINRIELETIEHFIFCNKYGKIGDKEKHMIQLWWDRVIVSAVATSDACKKKSLKNVFNSIAYWSSLSREKMERLLKRQNIDIGRITDMQQGNKVFAFANRIRPSYRRMNEEIRNFHG